MRARLGVDNISRNIAYIIWTYPDAAAVKHSRDNKDSQNKKCNNRQHQQQRCEHEQHLSHQQIRSCNNNNNTNSSIATTTTTTTTTTYINNTIATTNNSLGIDDRAVVEDRRDKEMNARTPPLPSKGAQWLAKAKSRRTKRILEQR